MSVMRHHTRSKRRVDTRKSSTRQHTPHVNPAPVARKRVVSARYPSDRIALLEAVQAREGDDHLADTISRALDAEIERVFPGTLVGA